MNGLKSLWHAQSPNKNTMLPEAPAQAMAQVFHQQFTRAIAYGTSDEIMAASVQLLNAAFLTSFQLGAKVEMINSIHPRKCADVFYTVELAIMEVERGVNNLLYSAVGKEAYKMYIYPVAIIDALYTVLHHMRIDAEMFDRYMVERVEV